MKCGHHLLALLLVFVISVAGVAAGELLGRSQRDGLPRQVAREAAAVGDAERRAPATDSEANGEDRLQDADASFIDVAPLVPAAFVVGTLVFVMAATLGLLWWKERLNVHRQKREVERRYHGLFEDFCSVAERKYRDTVEQTLLVETKRVDRLREGRETRIAALKQEVNTLLVQLGHEPVYREPDEQPHPKVAAEALAAPAAGNAGLCSDVLGKVVAPLAALQHPVRDVGLEKSEINVAFIPILCAAPLLYAKTHGYFAQNGLEVTLTPAPGWSGVKDLLAFGHTDAAHMLAPMPLAIRQGLDGRRAQIRLACIQNVNGQALTLAKKHAGIKDVREMKGFTFGVPYRFSMHYYLLCLFLAEHGLDPLRDVNIVEISPPRMPHFLDMGRVDGVLAPEPFGQIPVCRGTGFIYTLSKEIWSGHPCCCFASTEEFVGKYPKTYRAMVRSVLQAELALHRASPTDRRTIATDLSQPGILDQADPEPVAQALSGEYDDGTGRRNVDHDRIEFLPTPWSEYGSWILSQQQRWQQLCRRIDYRDVIESCFDGETREVASSLGFDEPGPNLGSIKSFRGADPFGYMQSQPFYGFTEQAAAEPPPIEQRIARLSELLAAAAGGRETPSVNGQADDAFGALEQLAGDLLKNIRFAQDALQDQSETLERTVRERLAESDQHRRNAISIAEDAESARRAAEASRAQYERVVSMISDIVWHIEVDAQDQIVNCYISPVADRLLGLPPGTIGNDMQKFFSYVEPDELPAVQETMFSGVRVFAKEVTLEYRLRKPDGATLWVRSKGSAFPLPNGNAAGFGTTSDVTERRRAEEAVMLKNALLSTQQEASIDGILAVDEDNKVILSNRRFEEMWNVPAELVESRDDATILSMVKDQVADSAAFLEKVTHLYQNRRKTSRDELVLKDGRVFDRYSAPMFGSDDHYFGRVWNFRDITDRKRMEDELLKAKDAADAANRAKSQFLANMSHEIRTPMTAVLGYADLILDEDIDATTREYLAVIKNNGKHLLGLISDILDLSKIEAGKLEIEPVCCRPTQVVAEVDCLMRPQAAAKNLKLRMELAASLPETVLTDPLRLREVLVNLLGNAIKFTDQGEVSLTARLEVENGRRLLRFDVSDTGIGMSPEQIGRLFRPFCQVDGSPTRKFGGTGLGLCISKHLAEALGGGIEVRSEPGCGSTFSVTIDPGPLNMPASIPQAQEAAATSQAIGQAAAGGAIVLEGRILLVEDVLSSQRLIVRLLNKAGAEVAAVENGQLAVDAALAACESGKPFDVILMDMQMPVMDGYQATSQLRKRGYTGPIIALTAHAMAEDCAKCLDCGCNDYVTKPIDRGRLLAAVAPWAARGRTHDNAAESTVGEPRAKTAEPAASIYSSLAADPDIGSLVDVFVQEMQDWIVALDDQGKSRDWSQMAETAHTIKGAAGTFGFDAITPYAARLHVLAREAKQEEQILTALAELVALCRRVRSGAPPAAEAAKTAAQTP
jgi:signal transduction histidine kinase/ABC-type nitrate/sulfonate/bicarbonate transport system substrate-binding protein/CheY-like chemotaxis protein/HPt (histidine-containing phosphotransfer) domain-containing protein